MNQPASRSTTPVENILKSSVASEVTALLGHEPVGLAAAGIDPAVLVRGLLIGDTDDLFATEPAFGIPEAAKRKVVEDEDEDDDDDAEDDDAEDEDEEEVEDDEDLDEDEDEEEDEDDDDEDDEDEEDDEFDDPDDDDDFDDDDDDDDFDDDE